MAKKSAPVTPLQKALDTLYTISGAPPIDVDNIINDLLKNTEKNLANQVDWISAINALSNDTTNKEANELIKYISSSDFVSSSSHMERINKYRDFIMIIKKVPIIKKILKLYTSNILAPDDVTKISLRTIPKDATIDRTSEEYISLETKIDNILDKIGFEKELYNLIFKTLLYGDTFIEIVSSKQRLLQTIYNLQIPFNDKSIKLNESLNRNDDISVINFSSDNTESNILFQAQIEWAQPLQKQISESVNFSYKIFNECIKYYNINESNFSRNLGIIKHISNELFDDSTFIDNVKKFKIFNESAITFNKDINTTASNSSPMGIGNQVIDRQFSLDYLPIQTTMSSVSIKVHAPDKIIVLKDEDIEYGFLYISSSIDKVKTQGGIGSAASSGGQTSQSFVSNSNFLNNHTAGMGLNPSGMEAFGGSSSNKFIGDQSKAITTKIATFIQKKFEEYGGNVNIDNMSSSLQLLISDILNKGSNKVYIRYIPPLNMQQFKIEGTGLNAPYGEGIVEDLLFRAKLLLADDINSILTKLTSSGKRMVWKVAANTHQQAANRIQQLSRAATKRTVSIDNYIDTMASVISPHENIFVAKINGEDQVDIDTLDLGSYQETTDPNMYYVKQLITGAEIPPAHLGYEEWTSGKNTLSAENVVFAQSIIGYQKEFSESITSLIQKIYLAIFSHTNEYYSGYKDLIIALNAPRGISLATYAEYAQNLDTIVNTLNDLEIPKEYIINTFWPELYDITIKTKKILEKLSGNTKGSNADSSGDSGGDGGMDMGGMGDLDMGNLDMDGGGGGSAEGGGPDTGLPGLGGLDMSGGAPSGGGGMPPV